MITVIGVNILHEFEVTGRIVARTSKVLDCASMQDMKVTLDRAYDDLFDGPLPDVLEHITGDLVQRSHTDGLLYLLPGDGIPGDLTVEALSARTDITLIPGGFQPHPAGIGRTSIVDALEIALAEDQEAYGTGLCPIDPTVPLVVTNWYGTSVVSLATRRLRRVYDASDDDINSWETEGRLVIPAIDVLDAPASSGALEHIVARLRRPDGCPWDREQTKESLLPQFIDELDELRDAITTGDVANQCEELGDVLFHIVAQCQLATEAGEFYFEDVLRGITAKLVRRHPHVFGDVRVETFDDVLATWNRVKAEEKAARGRSDQEGDLEL